MKKRVYMLLLLLCITMAATGCGPKETEEQKTDDQTEDAVNTDDPEQQEPEELPPVEDTVPEPKTTEELLADIDVAKCVTLGEYKNISLEKTIKAVTDDDIAKEIDLALAKYPVEVYGKKAEEGDTVNINYVGRINGEEFEGGSKQGADLQLGSGRFIPGFEDGLVGAAKGETRVLNLTFPSDFTAELSGKDVEFTVTVNAVKKPLEEATDEWVAANIEGYYTLAEYEEAIRSQQEETNRQTAEEQLRYTAWLQVVDNSTIHEYPETLVEMGRQLYRQEVESYARFLGMELEELLETSDMTMEEHHAKAEEYGRDIAARVLVNKAICIAEGYAIGDAAYQAELEKMIAEYGKTEEELMQAYGRDNVEQSIMVNRVCTLILEHATVTETSADSNTEE